jgi:polysaccharide export outer membrane protein
MPRTGSKRWGCIRQGFWVVVLLSAGCSTTGAPYDGCAHPPCAKGDVSQFRPLHDGIKQSRKAVPELPHELAQVSLPAYTIEPPDVLQIDAMRLIPKPPYRVNPLDVLGFQVTGTLPDAPIAGIYSVEPDGTIDLGFTYGRVKVEGLTLDEVKVALTNHLKFKLKPPYEVTSVALVESRGFQQIRGQHLVRPDGTVGLGVYGSVYVDGLTIDDARAAIEQHLSQFLLKPEISLDVAGFNSKVYYVITDGGGAGEQVARLPVMGKMTVLDAVSQINGLSPVSSKFCLTLVRPTPAGCQAAEEVYKIAWNDIVRRGNVGTNYQVLPGDRIYVDSQALIKTDTYLSRFLSPFERIFGTVGLGNDTVRTFLTPLPTNVNGFVTVH